MDAEPDWLRAAREKGLEITEGPVAKLPAPTPKKRPKLPGVTYSEEEFQADVIELAHLHGWKVAHFRKVRIARPDGSTYWQTPVAADGKGWLDLTLARPGRLIFAELKVGKNRPEAEQRAWMELLQQTVPGVEVYLWHPDDWFEIEKVLSSRTEGLT